MKDHLARVLRVRSPFVSRLLRWRSPDETRIWDQTDLHWPVSLGTTALIADNLRLAADMKDRLLFHVVMTKRRTHDAIHSTRDLVDAATIDGALALVHRLYDEAENTSRGGYHGTRDAVTLILNVLPPDAHPETVVLLLLILHQCLCVLDRGDQAFYVARLASALADSLLAADLGGAAIDRCAVQARCAQGVALHNMKLDGEAIRAFEAAERLAESRGVATGFWTPMVYRGKLLSAAALPPRRHCTAELVSWRNAVVVDGTTSDEAQTELLRDEALVQALVASGRPRALRNAVESTGHLLQKPCAGALYKVTVLRTASRVAAADGDEEGAACLRQQAISIAREAKLEHALRTAREIAA